MEKLLLSVAETAQIIGLGRSKTYELVASGSIESVRVGKSRRVPVDAVVRFVEGLRADNRDEEGVEAPHRVSL